jgi:hypothetical protein
MDDEYFSGGIGHCYYSPDYYYTFTTTILSSSCIFCEIIAGQTLQQLPEIIENCYQQNQLYHHDNHRIPCHHGNQKIMTQCFAKSSADQIIPTFNA